MCNIFHYFHVRTQKNILLSDTKCKDMFWYLFSFMFQDQVSLTWQDESNWPGHLADPPRSVKQRRSPGDPPRRRGFVQGGNRGGVEPLPRVYRCQSSPWRHQWEGDEVFHHSEDWRTVAHSPSQHVRGFPLCFFPLGVEIWIFVIFVHRKYEQASYVIWI